MKKKKQLRGMASGRKRAVLKALHIQYHGQCQKCGRITGIASELLAKGWVQSGHWLHSNTVQILMATIEHIIPRCHGGTNARDNLTLYCSECNDYTNPKKGYYPKRTPPSHVGPSITSIRGLRDTIRMQPKGPGS